MLTLFPSPCARVSRQALLLSPEESEVWTSLAVQVTVQGEKCVWAVPK